MDADHKLVISWAIGPRDLGTAYGLMVDLAERLVNRVQMTTDGLAAYVPAIEGIPMKYLDASAVLRVLFAEPGPSVPLLAGDHVVSSRLTEVEAFRAVDRERLLGVLSDAETAPKRKELTELLAMTDLAPVDGTVIDRAKTSFAVNLRAIDAIHVATAELLAAAADGEPLEFWTHDERQATAAMSRGLTRPRRRCGCSRLMSPGQPVPAVLRPAEADPPWTRRSNSAAWPIARRTGEQDVSARTSRSSPGHPTPS